MQHATWRRRAHLLHRVTTPAEALAAMGAVVGATRFGGTDIEAALLGAFALIRDAKRDDPDLARASLVLAAVAGQSAS